MEDTFRHKGLRKQLVDNLRQRGINSNKVLQAINKVPRHLFMDNAFVNFAYQDKAFPIAAGQTISQPYTVAFQTELLEIDPYDKVLEIGTGSGYQASVLSALDSDVYTIERQKELFKKVKTFLPSLGYSCKFFYGDGYKGLPKFAPFDKIIVTCGAPFIPEDLIMQLKVGGKMVVPVGDRDLQKMYLIKKESEENIIQTTHGNFSFVPMLSDKNDRL